MVYEVNVYLKSIVLTVFVFFIGIMVGILLDTLRVGEIKKAISESEIRWEDIRLLNVYLGKIGEKYCDVAFEENLNYNSRIYEYGKEIERRIEATTFTPEAEEEWRKYVLLQLQFWLNSIELKERCNFTYSNVVYLRNRKNFTVEEGIENKLQSSILLNLKEKCGRSVMLIPLTADSNLDSVSLILKSYNITKFPAVIIDEKKVFQGLVSMEELEKQIKCS